MGIFWLLVFALGIISANASLSSNNTTVCEEACKKCEDHSKKTRCLIQCPTVKNFRSPCTSSNKYNELVIGVSAGIVLCVIFAMGGILCVRLRKRKKDRIPKHSAKELKNFHKELDRLRPHAYTFLAILNNVRRQVRDMHRAGNTDAAVICGRSLSDLAKILMLLNRKDIPVIPPDWPRLFSWGQSLLQRSSLVNPPQQPQIGQLIHFLQTPTTRSRDFTATHSTAMSTLKPPAYEDYVPLQDQKSFANFQNGKQEWMQQWEFPQDAANDTGFSSQEDAWRSRHSNASENVWVDDEFFMMTFRPQDEIVTVL